jgi:hypothetical protein
MKLTSAILILSSLFLVLYFLEANAVCVESPEYQSVSGESARKWIENYTKENDVDSGAASTATEPQAQANESGENESDLWSWGKAPLGSEIVDGQLVRDPNYLRPLLNLSGNWLDESYTDTDTQLPVNVYYDPITERKYYKVLNPKTGKAFFTYYSYEDEKTGQTVYVYNDPTTGEEVHSSSAPTSVIKELVGGSYTGGTF